MRCLCAVTYTEDNVKLICRWERCPSIFYLYFEVWVSRFRLGTTLCMYILFMPADHIDLLDQKNGHHSDIAWGTLRLAI